MRYFWSLILILVLGTAGLSALRWSKSGQNGQGTAATGDATARSAPATPAASAPAEDRVAPPPPIVQEPERPSHPATEPAAIAESAPPVSAPIESPSEPATVDPAVARAEQPAAAPSDATVVTKPATPAAGSEFTLDGLLGVVAEAAERATPVAEPAPPASQPATDPMLAAAAQSLESQASTAAANTAGSADAPGPVGPAFRVRDDGSIEIESVGVITGAGTPQRPYVLDWDVLRSLSREFNPRQGQSEVPAWVMQLHGKRVRVEGNTLLPVVAQTTNELLVMQNPWDGCCLGVPPTPYDAIEVKLATMQRMGNSPTGYGQVEGVFKVDPYIVSGWLLGLYVIDEAGFESGAGITLPEL